MKQNPRMTEPHLFLTKSPDGFPEIGFKDKEGLTWYVNPKRLYATLFYKPLRDSFVDQVFLLNKDGDLASDINVYIADDEGNNTYWLFCAETLIWPEEDNYEEPFGTRNRYYENVLSVLKDYLEEIRDYKSNIFRLEDDGANVIFRQMHLQKLVGVDPYQLGEDIDWYQLEYFNKCLDVKEKFDLKILNQDIEWSFSPGSKNFRKIKTRFIRLNDSEVVVLKRALEDFCLTGDCRFKIQSLGSKDIQATTVVLHNVRDNTEADLSSVTEVIISPEDYSHHYPVLYGLGDTYEIIKKIYENFLKRLIPFSQYNDFKSSLIETFLAGGNPLKSNERKEVNHICEIAPDYDVHWQDEEGCCNTAEDGIIKITDDPGGYNTIYRATSPALNKWHDEYVKATDFVNTSTDESFDYKAWNRRGLALARTVRNQLPDDVDVWYMYPFEDKSHHSDEVLILQSSKQHLLIEAQNALIEEGVEDLDQWMELVKAFVAQSPYDSFFDEYTEVSFIDGDLDIYWFTPDLDCRASINLEEFTFHVWSGENHGQNDDECYLHAIGGQGTEKEYGRYRFARWFYDHMCSAKNLPNPNM